jgi:hypothetical protein
MPDPQKSGQHTAAESKAATKPASLAPAGESGDPEVHRLLAERQTAAANLAAATPDEAAAAKASQAREQITAIDKQLADLGFSAA